MRPPEIGEMAKVYLRGESPWAECVKILPDGRWIGRIANQTVASSPEMRQAIADDWGVGHAGRLPRLHNLSENDLVIFKVHSVSDEVCNWEPDQNQEHVGSA